MKTPQHWIDTFKEKDGEAPENTFYRISPNRAGDELFCIVRVKTGGYLFDSEGRVKKFPFEAAAIQAAWEHFISQPEVRGLMEMPNKLLEEMAISISFCSGSCSKTLSKDATNYLENLHNIF